MMGRRRPRQAVRGGAAAGVARLAEAQAEALAQSESESEAGAEAKQAASSDASVSSDASSEVGDSDASSEVIEGESDESDESDDADSSADDSSSGSVGERVGSGAPGRASSAAAGKAGGARKASVGAPSAAPAALSRSVGKSRSRKGPSHDADADGIVLEGDEEVRAEGDYSSDEEQERNTIGNVPLHWYEDQEHIGYDKAGSKLVKKAGMDEVDKVLANADDPFYRRTVYDAKNDSSTVLTDRELIMVRRLLQSKFPEAGMDAEPDYVPYYTSEVMAMPLLATPEPKSRFVPSKWERMKVLKLAHAIRSGALVLGHKAPAGRKPDFFLMWGEDDAVTEPAARRRKAPRHIPAPKVALPDHRESYHPPPEYLPTAEEAAEWLAAHPEDRKLNYLPTDFGSLRAVPGYANFVRERFERCLDLHLCPRVEKTRLNIDPDSLVPKLPSPQELRPYPTTVAVTYFGHQGRVRALAVSPRGELLASAGDDQTVKIWEVDTGRCLASYDVSSALDRVTRGSSGRGSSDEEEEEEEQEVSKPAVVKLAWNPQPRYRVLAVAVADRVVLLHGAAGLCCPAGEAEETFKLLAGALQPEDEEGEQGEASDEDELGGAAASAGQDEEDEAAKHKRALRASRGIAGWLSEGDMSSAAALQRGGAAKTTVLFKGAAAGPVLDLAWHGKGEYLCTVCDTQAASRQVTVLHVAKRLSQQPIEFKKDQRVQRVLFHPSKPILFVATKQLVNVYHLTRQVRIRTLKSDAKWISTLALHPKGDNLVLGTYDRRVAWFDLDISDRPWKTLKYHRRAVRRVDFHASYPLMATASDDGAVHVFHARVFDDFAKDPFLVPVKVLRAHTPQLDGLGVLDIAFHPTQPWIFSAGADGRVQLYQNIP